MRAIAVLLAAAIALIVDAVDALVHQPSRNAIRHHLPSIDGGQHPASTSRRDALRHHSADLASTSRRNALRRAFLAPIVVVSAQPTVANALEQCGKKSHNCIRTTWTAPSSLSASEVAGTIRDALNSYPQEGQSGVDCNGWKIVKDTLDADAGIITLEFKSCVGPAALAINLGQPFIDDLKLELGKDAKGNTAVEVKSSSRMGSSDLFVNRKRLQYLGKKLKEKGWTVPDPKYVYEMM
ncbi:hypothetical protein ACHAXT_005374 [Thalassiosira profunda]